MLWSYDDLMDTDDDNYGNDYYDDDVDDIDEYDFANADDNDYTNNKFHRHNSNENSYEKNYDDHSDDSYDEDYYYDDDDETEEIVLKLIEDYAQSIGSNVGNISNEIIEIFEFESALYNIMIEVKKRNNKCE